MGKVNSLITLSFFCLILIGFAITTQAQLISDYCEKKDSFGSIGGRVYYRVEKDMVNDNTWEIRGDNGVVGRIRRDTVFNNQLVIENRLGGRLGYIDDKSFINNLMRDGNSRISIEKDNLGNYVIREYGSRIGKINMPYNDTLSNLKGSDYSSNGKSSSILGDPIEEIRKWSAIPNPMEELRKQTLLPNPMEDMNKGLDLFNEDKETSSGYSFPSFQERKSFQRKNNLLPDPMEELKRSLNPWNNNMNSFSSPSFTNPSRDLFKIEPIKPFKLPSYSSPSLFGDNDDDEW